MRVCIIVAYRTVRRNVLSKSNIVPKGKGTIRAHNCVVSVYKACVQWRRGGYTSKLRVAAGLLAGAVCIINSNAMAGTALCVYAHVHVVVTAAVFHNIEK